MDTGFLYNLFYVAFLITILVLVIIIYIRVQQQQKEQEQDEEEEATVGEMVAVEEEEVVMTAEGFKHKDKHHDCRAHSDKSKCDKQSKKCKWHKKRCIPKRMT